MGGEGLVRIIYVLAIHPSAGNSKTQCQKSPCAAENTISHLQRTFDLPGISDSVTLLLMETSVPSWLENQVTSTPQPTSPPLASTGTALVKYPRTAEELTLMEITHENFMIAALDRIALGHPLKDIIEDDPRGISMVEFIRWVRKDKERLAQWREAEEIAAEVLIMQTLGIAEGRDSMEDTNRSTLRVQNNWRVAAAYSPKRFGKDTAAVGNAGSGGVTINIGMVESPYVVDNKPTVALGDVTDV